MIYFADTSALVKRYLNEAGSAYVRRLCAEPQALIYQGFLAPLEITSAFYRHYRAGDLSVEALSFLLRSYAGHSGQEYRFVLYSEFLIDSAERLIAQHPLRALDALQLAAALWLRDNLPSVVPTPIFLSADERLIAAALQEHLQAENPEKQS